MPPLERENPHATTREKPKQTAHHNEKIPHAPTKIPCAATKTRNSQKKKKRRNVSVTKPKTWKKTIKSIQKCQRTVY